MHRRRLMSAAALTNLGALSWPAAAQPAATNGRFPAGTPMRGGILNIAVSPEPLLLTSAFNTTMNNGQVSSKVLEGLISYDLNLQPVPALAIAWEISPDRLTVTFRLRDGVTWHDGRDFGTADVKFILEEVWKKLHPFDHATFANVTRVDTPDRLTVVVHLSSSAPYLLNYRNSYGTSTKAGTC